MARNTGFSEWDLTCNLHGKHEKCPILTDQSLNAPTNTFPNLTRTKKKFPLTTILPAIADHNPFDTLFVLQKPFNPYVRGSTTAKSSSSISSLKSPISISRTGDAFAPYVMSPPHPTHQRQKKHRVPLLQTLKTPHRMTITSPVAK
jgi:hypothetical protein